MKKKTVPFFLSPLITVGIVFLANPIFGITDILPDTLGCLFLWLGLTELSYIDSRMEYARKKILLLAAVSGAKLVLTPYVSRSAISSDMLAATAFFGVVEALLLILFVNDLYEGLAYAVSRKGEGESLRAFEGAKILAIVFILMRTLLNILPECAAIFELAAYTDITHAELYYSIAGLKNYFHLLNGFLVLIAGIWWAVSLCGIFRRLRKDTLFIAELEASYSNNYSGNIGAKVRQWLRIACRIVMVALVFFFQLDIGYTNVLPNFAGTALLLLGVAVMGIPLKQKLWKRFSLPVCIYAFVIQAAAYFYRAFAVDLTIDFFSQLVVKDVVICAVIAVAEFVSFVLVARMCEKIFNGYISRICPEGTSGLMYSVKIAVYASGFIYVVGYALPLLRGYLVVPQAVALVVIGAIINANINFVTGSLEDPEVSNKLCADSSEF